MDEALRSDDDDSLRYLFHATAYATVEDIAAHGLRPRTGAGVYNHGGYDLHSQGKVFAADGGAALAWFGKIEDQLAHNASEDGDIEERAAAIVPVLLRIDLDGFAEEPQVDELGSRDVREGTSYYFTRRIAPSNIEHWDPISRAWAPIDDGLADVMIGISAVEYYNEDGDPIDEDEWDGETPPGLTVIGPYAQGGFKPPYR
jgi:hypothetical protein